MVFPTLHPVLYPLHPHQCLCILGVPHHLTALLASHPVVHNKMNHLGLDTLLPQEAKPLAVLDSLPQQGLGLTLVGDGGFHQKDDIHQAKDFSQVDLQTVYLETETLKDY